MDTRKDRPAFERGKASIDAMNAAVGPNRVLHGALQAIILAKANAEDEAGRSQIEAEPFPTGGSGASRVP